MPAKTMFDLLTPSDDEEEQEMMEAESSASKAGSLPTWPGVPSLVSTCREALLNHLVGCAPQLRSIPPAFLSDIIGAITTPLTLPELQALPSNSITSSLIVGPRGDDRCLQQITRQCVSHLSILKNNNLNSSYLREIPSLTSLHFESCPKLTLGLLTATREGGWRKGQEHFKRPILEKLSLRSLHLIDCDLTDALLTELGNFPHLVSSLQDLDISANGFLTSEAFSSLAVYTNLTSLSVASTQFRAVEVLLSLENLCSFNCGFTLVGDSDLELLSGVTKFHSQLTNLNMACTGVTSDGLQALQTLKGLRTLNLSGSKLQVEAGLSLGYFTNLETLYIAGTSLLPPIENSPSLPQTWHSIH